MSTTKFVPYANESDVLHFAHLALENRVDRITISGDVDLTADQAGLALAKGLQRVLNDIVAALERQDLPPRVAPPNVKTVTNPFD